MPPTETIGLQLAQKNKATHTTKVTSSSSNTHNATLLSVSQLPQAMSVRIFPRRKAGQNSGMWPENGRTPLKLDLNSIQPLFAMPQKDAACTLGISPTTLKKVCRKLGIPSWAHVRDTRVPAVPVGPDVPPHLPATPTVELDSKPTCKPAHAPVCYSLDALLGAVDDDISMGSPIPEDSADLMCEDHSSDYFTSASSMASNHIEETAVDAPGHDSNDLAYLVPLPSGFVHVPNNEAWLKWYEESLKSFDC